MNHHSNRHCWSIQCWALMVLFSRLRTPWLLVFGIRASGVEKARGVFSSSLGARKGHAWVRGGRVSHSPPKAPSRLLPAPARRTRCWLSQQHRQPPGAALVASTQPCVLIDWQQTWNCQFFVGEPTAETEQNSNIWVRSRLRHKTFLGRYASFQKNKRRRPSCFRKDGGRIMRTRSTRIMFHVLRGNYETLLIEESL